MFSVLPATKVLQSQKRGPQIILELHFKITRSEDVCVSDNV